MRSAAPENQFSQNYHTIFPTICERRTEQIERVTQYLFCTPAAAAIKTRVVFDRLNFSKVKRKTTEPATVRAADEKEKNRRACSSSTGSENRTQARVELDAPFHLILYHMKGAQSMKTNEELAMMIQDGDESKVPELWEQVRKLYLKKSIHYYDSHRELCSRCGVELDDIQQQAFFAFLQSVEAYNPESGLSFLAFINYPFQTEMQNLTGTRTALTRLDPLNSCASLDKEIDTEDGSGDTLGDFVPDLTALDFLELLDAESVGEMIRAEVRKLSAPVCDVIESYYFNGQTLGTIAKRLGLSFERVRQLRMHPW